MEEKVTAEKLLAAYEKVGIPAPPIEALELLAEAINEQLATG